MKLNNLLKLLAIGFLLNIPCITTASRLQIVNDSDYPVNVQIYDGQGNLQSLQDALTSGSEQKGIEPRLRKTEWIPEHHSSWVEIGDMNCIVAQNSDLATRVKFNQLVTGKSKDANPITSSMAEFAKNAAISVLTDSTKSVKEMVEKHPNENLRATITWGLRMGILTRPYKHWNIDLSVIK